MRYLILFLFVPLKAYVSAQVLEISCSEPELVYNNHVGNEWAFALGANGKSYPIYTPLKLSWTIAGDLSFQVSETNETYNDFSSVSVSIDPNKIEMGQSYSKEVFVTITEHNGKYAGNKAQWKTTLFYKKLPART